MMGPTTAAVITAALAFAAHGSAAVASHAATTNARATAHSTERPHDELPGRGRVSSISVAPATTGAEVTIALDSGISVNHFVICLLYTSPSPRD